MKTLKEKHKSVEIKDIKKLKPVNNYVICKKIGNNLNSTTPAGIYKASEYFNRDQWLTQNVERVLEIVAVPDELDDSFGYWKTTMDAKPGDKAIVSFHDSLNCSVVISGGHEYRILRYFSIITLIRNKKLIPVNGYMLFTQVPVKYKTTLAVPDFMKKKLDLRYGVIEHLAPPNEYYTKEDKQDLDKGIDVKKGDKVVFISPLDLYAPKLESEIHSTLGKKYRYCQRFRIGGKI